MDVKFDQVVQQTGRQRALARIACHGTIRLAHRRSNPLGSATSRPI